MLRASTTVSFACRPWLAAGRRAGTAVPLAARALATGQVRGAARTPSGPGQLNPATCPGFQHSHTKRSRRPVAPIATASLAAGLVSAPRTVLSTWATVASGAYSRRSSKLETSCSNIRELEWQWNICALPPSLALPPPKMIIITHTHTHTHIGLTALRPPLYQPTPATACDTARIQAGAFRQFQ